MERFLFFNANEIAPGVFDREYVESDFADYFGSVLSTGLLHTDNVPGAIAAVEAGTLNTIVSPGKAIMKGHLYENTTPLTLTHSIPEATLDRIDRIVLRLDLRNQSRFIKLFVSEGVPSSTPVAPVLQRDQFIHEISLAQVRVRKNTVQLLPSDLVDERLNEQLCGLAHSLISIPTDQLQAFITAKRTELNVEMNTALDSYLASLAAAESKLASELVLWEQQWSDWFATIQGSAFVTGEEFATHKADMASQELGKGASLVGVHDAANLFTATTVEGALKETFTLASNGKTAVKNAVAGVDPTVVIPPNPTFPQLATAIGQISTGFSSGDKVPYGIIKSYNYKETAPTFKGDVLAIDALSNIYLLEGYTKIKKISPDFSVIWEVTGSFDGTYKFSDTLDDNGYLIVSGSPQFTKINTTTGLVEWSIAGKGFEVNGNVHVVSPSGDVYYGNKNVFYKINSDGTDGFSISGTFNSFRSFSCSRYDDHVALGTSTGLYIYTYSGVLVKKDTSISDVINVTYVKTGELFTLGLSSPYPVRILKKSTYSIAVTANAPQAFTNYHVITSDSFGDIYWATNYRTVQQFSQIGFTLKEQHTLYTSGSILGLVIDNDGTITVGSSTMGIARIKRGVEII